MYVYIKGNFCCNTGSPIEKSPSTETTCLGKRMMQNRTRMQGHVKQRNQVSKEDIDLYSWI